MVVVSSWQLLSSQCSKPTVEGTRQRLPYTNDRLGKSILSHSWDFAEHCLPVCLHCRNYEFIKWCWHVQQSVCDCASCMSQSIWMSTRVQCEHNERARNSTVNFLWLTSSSSLSASSCHRSCRVRRGEGEGGSGEAGRDVMFQLDYRHLYIWYNNIISIVGNIGFTLFHHFITLYLITASCSSPFPFSSPLHPSYLPPPHTGALTLSILLCSSTSWSKFPLMTCSLSIPVVALLQHPGGLPTK